MQGTTNGALRRKFERCPACHLGARAGAYDARRGFQRDRDVEPRHAVRAGERISFSVSAERLEFFDLDTGLAIWD